MVGAWQGARSSLDVAVIDGGTLLIVRVWTTCPGTLAQVALKLRSDRDDGNYGRRFGRPHIDAAHTQQTN